jgi:hypothetical protein
MPGEPRMTSSASPRPPLSATGRGTGARGLPTDATSRGTGRRFVHLGLPGELAIDAVRSQAGIQPCGHHP